MKRLTEEMANANRSWLTRETYSKTSQGDSPWVTAQTVAVDIPERNAVVALDADAIRVAPKTRKNAKGTRSAMM